MWSGAPPDPADELAGRRGPGCDRLLQRGGLLRGVVPVPQRGRSVPRRDPDLDLDLDLDLDTAATADDALPPAAQGIEDCPGEQDRPFALRRGEDRIHGHARGRSKRVVVLTHQFRGTPCDLSGLAAALAAHGWRAVSWTTDTSPTPRTLRLLVEHERDRGARTVVLAGASAGGATSVVAAAGIRPRVDAVVALSPSGYAMEPGDVVAAAGRWSGPMLVVAGALEPGFADVAKDVAAAHGGDEELLLVPDAAEHGKDYVRRRTDPVTARVVAFLAASVRHP